MRKTAEHVLLNTLAGTNQGLTLPPTIITCYSKCTISVHKAAWETVRDSTGQFVTSSPSKLRHQELLTKHMEKHFEKKNDDFQVKLAKAETLTLAVTNDKLHTYL